MSVKKLIPYLMHPKHVKLYLNFEGVLDLPLVIILN